MSQDVLIHGEPAPLSWTSLVDGIRRRDKDSMLHLYLRFNSGLRFLILRQLGQDAVEDVLQDCMTAVITAIQEGGLNDAERLPAFVHTVLKRKIIGCINERTVERSRKADLANLDCVPSKFGDSPEESVSRKQLREVATHALAGMSRSDRDILRRFYVAEQSQEQICAELSLSYHQFKNAKYRAKAKFEQHLRKATDSRPRPQVTRKDDIAAKAA